RQPDRFLTQVSRSIGGVVEHLQHIARLKGRSNAIANGLRGWGDDNFGFQAKSRGYELKEFSYALCMNVGAYFRRWPHRQVDQEVRGACRNLFRENRGHHLLRRIDGEWPL